MQDLTPDEALDMIKTSGRHWTGQELCECFLEATGFETRAEAEGHFEELLSEEEYDQMCSMLDMQGIVYAVSGRTERWLEMVMQYVDHVDLTICLMEE